MRLKRTPSKREFLSAQLGEVHRVTKAKVKRAGRCAGRSSAFKRWVGLPKPACESDFNPLPLVTSGILHVLGAENDAKVRRLEREQVARKRVEMIEYLRTRTVGKDV